MALEEERSVLTEPNDEELVKVSEERLGHGAIVSFAGPPQQDVFVYVYVYKDVPVLKRKALGQDDGDIEKPKVSRENLANARLPERSNQELQKELEEKSDSLTAVGASHAVAESRIKEATDNQAARHSEKIVHLEEALRRNKASRVELEQKLEEECLKWKRETEASCDTATELDCRVEAFKRRLQQMEHEIQALQETKKEDRAQIESLRTEIARLDLRKPHEKLEEALREKESYKAGRKEKAEEERHTLERILLDLNDGAPEAGGWS